MPVQLLVLHLRKNQLLLLCWTLLLAVVTGNFGKGLGIPYLFLDPEYLGQVDAVSFLIVGVALGGFTMAYHITCYILDGPSFGFLGTLSRPFAKFSLNNGLVPLLFILIYSGAVVKFQWANEYSTIGSIFFKLLGLWGGFLLMSALLFEYFRQTNKDIFRYLAANVDQRLKRVRISRVQVMANLKEARRSGKRVDRYVDLNLAVRRVTEVGYDKALVLKVFDQNHINSVTIEVCLLALILALGIFQDHPYFQIPAAASVILMLTILLMVIGAASHWLRGWTTTAILVGFAVLNLVVKNDWAQNTYEAFGLNYQAKPAEYSLTTLQQYSSKEYYQQDKAATEAILDTWLAQTRTAENPRPKMVLTCASGGGLRAALWTTVALQTADSVTSGNLMKHTRLMTGASGGLIGAAYFREVMLRESQRSASEEALSPYSRHYQERIAQDDLNPIIFSLLVNDLFIRHQTFDHKGKQYTRDRGYAFEQQFNENTEHLLDKPLIAYQQAEREARIPMLLLAPSIVNDGRKMYISSQHVSYMNRDSYGDIETKVKGVDFLRFFAEQGSPDLRFLTALRMNAAFPYVTPNVTLPTQPRIQIMDAGMTDNFGVADAVRFMYVFQDWINEHTSGVVLLTIRDSEKNERVEAPNSPSLIQKMTAPFRFFYDNLFNVQDINNDDRVAFARAWLEVDLQTVTLEYSSPDTPLEDSDRPSLSWRLTSREKNNIIRNIQHPKNQRALEKLQELLP